MKSLIFLLLAFAVTPVRAQSIPPPQQQKGIGPTGTMYDSNNLARFPLAPSAPANAVSPAARAGGVTGAQVFHDENGTGAGGGEH